MRGSGVFVSGADFKDAGSVKVDLLSTGTVFTDGGIAPRTPDVISGGVFVVYGAHVDKVLDQGPVSTRGQNDMVLDNWGTVTIWQADAPITSFGPSGIGFVNFGDIDQLIVNAPIVTNGVGARGYNLYDGSANTAQFQSILTHGDGAVGIQLSRPSGPITVRESLQTTGGTGLSLVKGVQLELSAIAFSIKPGGSLKNLEVGQDIRTSGDNLTTVEIGGPLAAAHLGGHIYADGKNSTPLSPPDNKVLSPFIA